MINSVLVVNIYKSKDKSHLHEVDELMKIEDDEGMIV